jgi:hypothetical protein
VYPPLLGKPRTHVKHFLHTDQVILRTTTNIPLEERDGLLLVSVDDLEEIIGEHVCVGSISIS